MENEKYYTDANSFFELFEQGDFDKEVTQGNTWKGLALSENTGEFEEIAGFTFDSELQTSGTGWYL